MNSKLLVIDNCSKLEAELSEVIPIDNVALADRIVNPTWSNLIGKEIIINLPLDPGINIKKLCRYNKVISRFPIEDKSGIKLKYELVPYEPLEFMMIEGKRSYNKRILNKYIMRSDEVPAPSDARFLLGTDVEVNGYLTAIGYIIQKTIKQ